VPAKYHIHTEPAPPRFRPIGKLGIVDWREDCSSCHNCVKKGCVYGFYRKEADTLHDELGYLDYIYQCKGCLNCIQNCTKGILTRVVNPEYMRLGDSYYTPDIILTTWFQAETGKIPVSGAGYGGPFSGPGFDSFWTDMSEIVRPTRDGIHGREYISTSVDIGRTLPYLVFRDGQLTVSPPTLIEIPLPVIFDVVPKPWQKGAICDAVIRAASEIGLMAVVPGDTVPAESGHIIPLYRNADDALNCADSSAAMVMVADSPNVTSVWKSLKEKNPNRIVAVRAPASPESHKRAVELTREGVEVIQFDFDPHGMEHESSNPRHLRDVMREIHLALVKEGIRDEVTLIASGGIALAEHMAKAIICGANLVAVDIPLMVALECRLCGECERGEICPVDLAEVEPEYAARRMVNLMGAWHSQLLEMLGAMGIREVRRLRGETGRSMFFEDLERDNFGRLFGKRKDRIGA